GYIGGDDENSGADHGTHHQSGGAGEAEPFDELGILRGLSGLGVHKIGNSFYIKLRRKSSTVFAGDASKPEMTATESAPESITERAFESVIPPIATKGLRTAPRIFLRPFNPTTGSGRCLLLVAKIGPMAM